MAAAKTKSDNTDAVISSAAAALVKATASIQEAFKSIDGLNETAETLTRDIATKKAEVAGLDEQYQVKARQAEVDFNLRLQETKDKTVTEYLKSVGKEAVESAVYKELQSKLALVVSERDTEVKRAVAIENSRLTRDYNSEKALLQSQFETASAKQLAQIESLTERNGALSNEIAKLFKEIEAQRALTAEVAKAGSVGSINVGTPNNR
jgi:flagellar motor protein MotB